MAAAPSQRLLRPLRREVLLAALGGLAVGGAMLGALAALAPTGPDAPLGGPGGVVRILVSAGAAGLVAGLAAMWGLTELRLLRRLRALAAEAQFLAEATRDTPLDLTATGPLTPLAEIVNRLAGRVVDAERDVTDRVAAATRRADETRRLLEGILRDLSEGVVVCSLDHRVLLYNQAALSILRVSGDLGLGRSLFAAVSGEPVVHALDRLIHRAPGETSAEAAAVLVCATVNMPSLLRCRMSLVLGAAGEPAGYILSIADATRELAELERRERLLTDATDGLRHPIANLRAAAETLASFPDLPPEERRAFEGVVMREAEALTQRLAAVDRDAQGLAAAAWPMADIHSLDLVACVARRLTEEGGPSAVAVGLPLWLHGDSHTLVVALDRILRRLAAATGQRSFDLEALLGDRRVYIEIAWEGAPVPAALIDRWMEEPMVGTPGARTLGEIVRRHGSELWSAAKPEVPGVPDRSMLRIPLPPPARPHFRGPTVVLPERPEFYDFDLLEMKPADGRQEALALRAARYVVFDTETTGLKPSEGDEIVAIGAVPVVNGRVLSGETFTRLVNPGRPIPAASIRFHNITDAMVADAPPIAVVLPQFHRFVGSAVLVAHNAAFDLAFLRRKEDAAGLRFDHPVLDTLLLSLFLWRDLPDHDLDAIARRLGIAIAGRHSALGDALATAAVFQRMLDLLEARGIATLGALLRASNMMLEIRARQAQF